MNTQVLELIDRRGLVPNRELSAAFFAAQALPC